jgi:hypothetical protein
VQLLKAALGGAAGMRWRAGRLLAAAQAPAAPTTVRWPTISSSSRPAASTCWPDGTAVSCWWTAARGHVRRGLKAVAALPGRAGPTLFNTHWHPEQTGSNETLGKAGAQIIAQENTRLWLTTDVKWPWNGQTVQAAAEGGAAEQDFLYTATV